MCRFFVPCAGFYYLAPVFVPEIIKIKSQDQDLTGAPVWGQANVKMLSKHLGLSHFLILVNILSALLTNIKFGEGWSQTAGCLLCYVYSKDKTT